ncbi:hypothetical protein TMatcc_007528 [Talaromyces marneffei ATCC 18224]
MWNEKERRELTQCALPGDKHRVSKCHEREDPDKNPDSVSLQILQCANIHSLRANSLISQPIAKVDTLNHGRGPFMTTNESKSLNGVLNISMTPILAFDGGYRSDVYINDKHQQHNKDERSRRTALESTQRHDSDDVRIPSEENRRYKASETSQ